MNKIVVRLLLGAAMMMLALIFTGLLAVTLEQRAEDRQSTRQSYVPPRLENLGRY